INKEVGKLWEEEHVRLGLYSTRDIQKQPKEEPLHMKYLMHGVSHFMGTTFMMWGANRKCSSPEWC
ncbi:MAG: hypothetical protein V3V53_13290, partial [Bacteroidales bacterium]